MNCNFNNWEDLMELMECHVYIYIYIYIYICNHENNEPSRLSPQWLCGNHALGNMTNGI